MEACEVIQKQLKGNAVAKRGMSRYKLISNETSVRQSFDHFKIKNQYKEVTMPYVVYGCEPIISTFLPFAQLSNLYETEANSSYFIWITSAKICDEKILIEESFSKKVWKKVLELYNENREEAALLFLYESLHNELWNFSNCDSFLRSSIDMPMNSDQIVHILNAVSSIKSKLHSWEEFKLKSFKLLQEEVGADTAKKLMNAAV